MLQRIERPHLIMKKVCTFLIFLLFQQSFDYFTFKNSALMQPTKI